MNIYNRKRRWKLLLFFVAILIGAGSLFYTNFLMKKLSDEERKRVELWAKANEEIQKANPDQDVSFIFHVLLSNNTIPVILATPQDSIISYRNLDSLKMKSPEFKHKTLEDMKKNHAPIEIKLLNEKRNFIYFNDSTILTQLYYYPFIQLGIITLFILVSYLAFSNSRKSEQNHVWLGMSKETAHQLGTPISSLMGWIEVLKLENPENPSIKEMEKDVKRLERVAERFSKIGSAAALNKEPIQKVLRFAIDYIQNRSSKKINFEINIIDENPIIIPLSLNLFEWVIENICRNAIDAMEGKGKITINLINLENQVMIDISDTGKGIIKSKHKTVFQPGYTTKQRGWGLGLSLSKRIIEEYHNGRIFIKQSDPKTGTTFRIILNK
ncbi:MAG: HAMP domain-containing sensor histidine kinase [Bacteroidota bacterium]|nr:HAMP domain-containing sensor histidine kinase [Bacteroidota bacterium]